MNILQASLVWGVRLYRWVLSPAKSVLFGPLGRCRFSPSCSTYALESLETHGAIHGGWLSLKRICRCHPWGGCGHDPVPARSPARVLLFSRPGWSGAPAVKATFPAGQTCSRLID